MKMHAIGFYFILLSISSAGVNATHFRGAIFTWTSADDGSTVSYVFDSNFLVLKHLKSYMKKIKKNEF